MQNDCVLPDQHDIKDFKKYLYVNRFTTFIANEVFQFAIPFIALVSTHQVWIPGIIFGVEWLCRLTILIFGSKISSYSWSASEKSLIFGRIFGAIEILLAYIGRNSIQEFCFSQC